MPGPRPTRTPPRSINLFPFMPSSYQTTLGRAHCGDALLAIEDTLDDQSIQLIVTSPPYALLTEKSYGNKDQDSYVDWFLPFARKLKQKLRPNGSFVINLGGAWLPGRPVRSLYMYELLLRLCDEDLGFNLCQEFYWYNPAKLPAPIEWVNRRRVRVKDSIESVFWLSQSDDPPADNREVLVEYSSSMKRLLKTKKYNWGERPSGHKVGTNWATDNGGAIPPNLILSDEAREAARRAGSQQPGNLLVESNTASQGDFFRRCREENRPLHPARFPSIIPEFFVRFLTEEGDLVCDPFAGSNTTGAVCEQLGRRWESFEKDAEHFRTSALRFDSVTWSPDGP